MVPGKDQVVFQTSDGLKEAIGKYAAENNLSMSEVWQQAGASLVGYDRANDPARSRAPKYATEQEQKDAQSLHALLLRWGKTTSARLLVDGQIEAATLIAKAVEAKDYETLESLKTVSDEVKAAMTNEVSE